MHYNFPIKFYFINSFKKNKIDNLDNNTAVIYRNYNKKLKIAEIIKIRNYCNKKNIKFFLSNNVKIALKLRLNGVYIPSFNKDFKHVGYSFNKSFKIIGSAHNVKEIRIKERQNVEIIFLSSIFKKNKNYLGIYRFKQLMRITNREIICLGGISKSNIKKINLLSCLGFSGISYFE